MAYSGNGSGETHIDKSISGKKAPVKKATPAKVVKKKAK